MAFTTTEKRVNKIFDEHRNEYLDMIDKYKFGKNSRLYDCKTTEDGRLVEIDEEILDMRNAGLSYRSIANDLNERGIVGKRGGKYFASTIRNVCENTLYDDLKEAA